MARFVICRYFLFFRGKNMAFSLGTEHDFFNRLYKVHLRDRLSVVPRGKDRRFVNKVCEIGSRKTRRAFRDKAELNIFIKGVIFCVHFQNVQPVVNVRKIKNNPSVKPSRAKKRRIKNVGAVGGGHHYNGGIGLKTIHFYEYLIKGLLTLIIPSANSRSAVPSYGINFVYEHDSRPCFFCDLKKIVYAGGANADEHFNKF